jgi:antibiotic biosynthesis monooxygenase (ABM) superfamily enzyme
LRQFGNVNSFGKNQNDILTTPIDKEMMVMPYSLSRLKVEDYAKWKPVFDQISDARKASGGAKRGILLRDADNPNEITILIEWDNLENARKFIQSEVVKKSLKVSGTIKSDFYFLNEVEQIKI